MISSHPSLPHPSFPDFSICLRFLQQISAGTAAMCCTWVVWALQLRRVSPYRVVGLRSSPRNWWSTLRSAKERAYLASSIVIASTVARKFDTVNIAANWAIVVTKRRVQRTDNLCQEFWKKASLRATHARVAPMICSLVVGGTHLGIAAKPWRLEGSRGVVRQGSYLKLKFPRSLEAMKSTKFNTSQDYRWGVGNATRRGMF